MERLANLFPTGRRDLEHHRGARRSARRYPLHADVEVTSPKSAEGVVINASTGGIRVAVDRGFEEGDVLELRLTFAQDKVGTERAEVVWSRALPDGHLLGLRFVAS